MSEPVEPRVRRVVAEHLGVGVEELGPAVSLTDDLAADSLDMLELAITLEGQFGIAIPESLIDDVHRYGDLVDLVRALHAKQQALVPEIPMVLARVMPADGRGDAILERAGQLTPYTAETIADDALHAGRGARLEMFVPTNTSDVTLGRLEDDFAWLERRGVHVSVRRDRAVDPAARGSHPHAA